MTKMFDDVILATVWQESRGLVDLGLNEPWQQPIGPWIPRHMGPVVTINRTGARRQAKPPPSQQLRGPTWRAGGPGYSVSSRQGSYGRKRVYNFFDHHDIYIWRQLSYYSKDRTLFLLI